MAKETIVINLLGEPGVGKTKAMAEIFAKLKAKGIDAEMVSEFAKELVYENRGETMKDEQYIYAKQAHRLFRVYGKVDVIVTDRPLILTIIYNNLYGKKSAALDALVLEEFNSYNNINYYLHRTEHEYQHNGRLQDETEAQQINNYLRNEVCAKYNIQYTDLNVNADTCDKIVDDILKLI